MNHRRRRFAFSIAALLLVGSIAVARAQSARAVATSARLAVAVRFSGSTRLAGHVPAWANAGNDLGSLPGSRRLDNLHLILTRAPQVEAALQQLLTDQQNPASPRYRHWLTPQQNATQYGVAPSDLAAVTAWLQSQGLTVDDVAAGGVFITFSGPVSLVERAFSISLHSFSHENEVRYAPTVDPAIPAALAGVLQSVDGLAEEFAHVHSHTVLAIPEDDGPRPMYNSGASAHYLAPGDFNTIYDILPTANSGINGAGTRVVNLIDSRIAASDITGFNSVFGLSVAQPNTILLPGSADPGISATSEGEAALDVQRILGTAPGTTVDLLVFSNLSFTNIFSALQYEVGTLNDPIVNMSFGACNAGSSSASHSASFDAYFKTGAAQGISFFVSSGDDAAAGCDNNYSTIPAIQVLATNLICASSYATCVGGTEFAENGGGFWSGSNSSTRVSATGYIPEGAWNEPASVSNGKTTYQASGTGGGLTLFPKPTWQTGTGVPADGIRDVPDVSFTSSYHDGYLVCQADIGNACSSGTFKYIVFGTSASSPSLAGITALLNQKLGARQGNLNPLFYRLAATPGNSVFHDVTVATSGAGSCSTAVPSLCNNSTPSSTSLTGGLAGYVVGAGYDLATGLGSLDVTNFLAAAGSANGSPAGAPAFTMAAPASLNINSGATSGNTAPITLGSSNGFAGTVALTCFISAGTEANPPTCTLSPATVSLASGGAATTVAVITTALPHTSSNRRDAREFGVVFALLLCVMPFRKRKLRSLAAVLFLAAGFAGLSGCGSGGNTTAATVTASSAGRYTVTVAGVAAGAVNSSVTFTLTVN